MKLVRRLLEALLARFDQGCFSERRKPIALLTTSWKVYECLPERCGLPDRSGSSDVGQPSPASGHSFLSSRWAPGLGQSLQVHCCPKGPICTRAASQASGSFACLSKVPYGNPFQRDSRDTGIMLGLHMGFPKNLGVTLYKV